MYMYSNNYSNLYSVFNFRHLGSSLCGQKFPDPRTCMYCTSNISCVVLTRALKYSLSKLHLHVLYVHDTLIIQT